MVKQWWWYITLTWSKITSGPLTPDTVLYAGKKNRRAHFSQIKQQPKLSLWDYRKTSLHFNKPIIIWSKQLQKFFLNLKLNIPVPVQLFIIYPHPTKNVLNPYYKSQYFKNPGHKNKKAQRNRFPSRVVLHGEGGS